MECIPRGKLLEALLLMSGVESLAGAGESSDSLDGQSSDGPGAGGVEETGPRYTSEGGGRHGGWRGGRERM